LLERGGLDVNSMDNKGRSTLILAVENDSVKMMRRLLQIKDIDVNRKALDGRNALLIDMAHMLLEREDLDINVRDTDGNTTLMNAITYSAKTNIVRLMLGRRDLDINSKNNDGRTALSYAGLRWNANNAIDIVRLLLERKDIDINSKDNDGRTALWYAEIYRPEIAELLGEKGGTR
ncbi:ankyrin repeat-containing domain protein, partial [Pyronema domesticum]